jgi:hypothetical protein
VINSSTHAVTTQPWGQSGDVPTTAFLRCHAGPDYAVWRPSDGTWYVTINPTGC